MSRLVYFQIWQKIYKSGCNESSNLLHLLSQSKRLHKSIPITLPLRCYTSLPSILPYIPLQSSTQLLVVTFMSQHSLMGSVLGWRWIKKHGAKSLASSLPCTELIYMAPFHLLCHFYNSLQGKILFTIILVERFQSSTL